MTSTVRAAVVAALTFGLVSAVPSAAKAKPEKPSPTRAVGLLDAGQLDAAAEKLVAAVASKRAAAEIDAFAAALARDAGLRAKALAALRAVEAPLADSAAAEVVFALSRRRTFYPEVAAVAAELLDHDDAFVRALAEWACALKVQRDNAGEKVAWPREDPPPWFEKYLAVPAEDLVALDYARQLIAWNSHRTVGRVRSSAGKVLSRAEGLAARIRAADAPRTTAKVLDRRLAELRGLAGKLAGLPESADAVLEARSLWLAMRRAARRIVLARPEVDFEAVVYTTRHPGHSLQNITGSQYPWAHKPGGDIVVHRGLGPEGDRRAVLDGALGEGHVHGMDLWWDADRVVFAWARQDDWPPKHNTASGNDSFPLRGSQEPTHLYEVALGSATKPGAGAAAPRQITDHPYWSDFEPTYLADGSIAFASDRSGRSSECGKFSADHTVINIYAVGPDGTGLRRLSDNKDIDRYPHSLDNGLIAYTRWDYQERHFFEVHSIWTVRPDGTMADAVFNQHLRHPFGLRETRSIPGSERLVSIATGHHTLAYGPVVVIDPHVGINTPAAIEIVTPHVRPQEGGMAGRPSREGGVPDRDGLYQTPWALSEDCFLVSYTYETCSPRARSQPKNGFAVYLIDVFGHKELIARDRVLSCCFAMPLRPRPRPPVLSETVAPDEPFATCYVTDVYEGLTGIPRGEAKYIRVAQRVGWPLDDKVGAMRWIPGNAWERQFGFWSWAPVRVIGEVPVEPDGSAHFKVPVDTAVYFQVLDEKRMELYRMRSHVTFQPGEARGCRGCHETQPLAPHAAGPVPAALTRPADTPAPPPWGSRRLIGYEDLIQPILDEHCVKCHAPAGLAGSSAGEGKKPAAGLDFSAGRGPDGFCQSFRTMFGYARGSRKRTGPVLVSVSNRFSGHSVSRPKEFGSHRSKLVRVLLDDARHRKNVRLSEEQWRTLVTWVDVNAPYHDRFFNRRPDDGGAVRNIRVELPAPFEFVPHWNADGVRIRPETQSVASDGKGRP